MPCWHGRGTMSYHTYATSLLNLLSEVDNMKGLCKISEGIL